MAKEIGLTLDCHLCATLLEESTYGGFCFGGFSPYRPRKYTFFTTRAHSKHWMQIYTTFWL
jgi:hypothetical protein